MRFGFIVAAIAFGIFGMMLISGCTGSEEARIELHETPILVGRERYALLTETYIRFHEEPEIMAPVVGHGRVGDVLEVVGTTADQKWIELSAPVGSGWVQSIYLRRFSNREQAINARRLLDETDSIP